MSLFRKRKKELPRELTTDEDIALCNEKDTGKNIATGYSVAESARLSTQQAAQKYAKPDTYTGNRMVYDSGVAKRNIKMDSFKDGVKVSDPYTGKKLVLTKKEAKAQYGEKWADHLAEADHINPLEKVYEDTKGNVWNTTDDIKAAANSEDNLEIISRKINNAKRSRTNKEFVEDEEYLRKHGIKLSEDKKQSAIRKEELAKKSIKKQLKGNAVKNVLKTGHEAGMQGAKSAGVTTATMSGIMNLVAVIKGEKDSGDAIADTLEDSGKAMVSGYIMGDGLTTISHTLSGSSSKFLRALSESNVPGKVITAVTITGNTLKRYGNGEITTQECLLELGDKGVNLLTMPYAMAAGQALIPIPIVGGAVGALVGTVLTSNYYNGLVNIFKTKELEHQERLRIIAECNAASEQLRAFGRELESYLESYFREYRDCFDEALSEMRFAYQIGDADGMIAGANQITRKLGGQVHYETVEQFKDFLNDGATDIL